MVHLNWSFCVVLLMYSWHQIQVHAFLNVTAEVLDMSHKLVDEIEKQAVYRDQNDLINKIISITEIFAIFANKTEDYWTDIFYEDFSEKAYATSDSLGHSNSHFEQLLNKILSDFHIFYTEYSKKEILKNPREYGRLYVENLAILLSKFIKGNDYHLHRAEVLIDDLNAIHNIPIEIDEDSGQSIVSLRTNETEARSCRRQSQQQLVFNMVKIIAFFDAKGHSLMQYSLAVYKIFFDAQHVLNDFNKETIHMVTAFWENKNFVAIMKQIEQQFIKRNVNTLKIFKTYMAPLSRELRKCDVPKNDDTYTKLEQVFQKYIINEVDLNKGRSCKKDCPFYNQAKVYGCYDQKICAHQRQCSGTVWNCDSTVSAAEICPSNADANSRYKYIEVGGHHYGQERSCINTVIDARSWPRGIFVCSYCMCTCENSNSNSERYFNLIPVTSNLDLNYVITGVRFQKKNQIIHIQIQQAEILQNGIINSTTLHWKEVHDYKISDQQVKAGIDYHVISWNERTVCLDTFDSPNNNVLTGVRFKLTNGYLKLEIRVTQFDFTTGKLAPETSTWHSNDADLKDRSELSLNNYYKDIPANVKSDQYFQFTTSPLEFDAGQTTIPYIDMQSVESFRSVPLSGAGIFLKSDESLGHFLALKLITYNPEPHLKV